jgi:hypothetical protein
MMDQQELLVCVIGHLAKVACPGGKVPEDPIQRSAFVDWVTREYLRPNPSWCCDQMEEWRKERDQVRSQLAVAAAAVCEQQSSSGVC